MKVTCLLFSAAALLLGSCASAPGNAPARSLDLSLIERIEFGKSTGSNIVNLIGQPDRIVHLKRDLADKDAWIFAEREGDQRFERLGFLVDRKTGIVQSATWSIRDGDPFRRKQMAVSHFKSARFIAKKVGRVAPDYFSDESTLSDQRLGISLNVDDAKGTVSSITFTPPEQRRPAENQK